MVDIGIVSPASPALQPTIRIFSISMGQFRAPWGAILMP